MKLSKSNISKLKENAKYLNNGAVRLLLFVAMRADESGMAQGIYYKEFSEKTGMCNQSFYNAKETLIHLGFIKEYKRDNKDIDILLLDNKFITREDYKKGYIDLNRNILTENKDFWKLTDNAIIMSLDFLKNALAAVNGSYRIKKKKLYENYKDYFKVSSGRICSYLRELKKFFSIGTKDGITYIKPRVEMLEHNKTAAKQQREHQAKMIIRRTTAVASGTVMNDLMDLISQYINEALEQSKNIVMLLQECVRRSLGKLKGQERIINAPYVHKLIRRELDLL